MNWFQYAIIIIWIPLVVAKQILDERRMNHIISECSKYLDDMLSLNKSLNKRNCDFYTEIVELKDSVQELRSKLIDVTKKN